MHLMCTQSSTPALRMPECLCLEIVFDRALIFIVLIINWSSLKVQCKLSASYRSTPQPRPNSRMYAQQMSEGYGHLASTARFQVCIFCCRHGTSLPPKRVLAFDVPLVYRRIRLWETGKRSESCAGRSFKTLDLRRRQGPFDWMRE